MLTQKDIQQEIGAIPTTLHRLNSILYIAKTSLSSGEWSTEDLSNTLFYIYSEIDTISRKLEDIRRLPTKERR